jgi:RimJ/RimL family protein N-acetyltransferase
MIRWVLEARAKQHSVDIGYVLAPHLWRRGLMGEAVRGLVHWAMNHPEVYRIWAVCDVENIASARLLESAGMQLEGRLRRWLVHPNMSESPRDCLCYAAVKAAG